MKSTLNEFQKYCLINGITFVSYVMPGATEPITLYVGSNQRINFKNIEEIPVEKGFLFSPFQNENLPVIAISDDNTFQGWEFIGKYPSVENHDISQNSEYYPSVTFSDYEFQIEYLKKHYLTDESKKIVLSRTKQLEMNNLDTLPILFEELAKTYKHAFVYLLHHPVIGTWIGATPETLVNIESTQFSTMALAATTANTNQIHNWTASEIKEQEHVVTYLRKKLEEGGYSFSESERSPSVAGNVVHLKTLFQGSLKQLNYEWKFLVDLLYPTPAICGTHDRESLALISQMEKHHREYYSGIIGPFDNKGNTSLFINLRCMKVAGEKAILFAGSGILQYSKAEKEWDETELKFLTLEGILEKIKAKA